MSESPPCLRLQTNRPATRDFVVGADKGLADVLVSVVAGLKGQPYPRMQTNHKLEFANCQLQPYVSAISVGQPLDLFNRDDLSHLPHLITTNNLEQSFRIESRSGRQAARLARPELFLRISCKLHPWEAAYVSVVEHPFFAITDTNGNFVIPNVPAGKYTLRALHRKAGATNELPREVTLNSGEIVAVNFTLNAPGD